MIPLRNLLHNQKKGRNIPLKGTFRSFFKSCGLTLSIRSAAGRTKGLTNEQEDSGLRFNQDFRHCDGIPWAYSRTTDWQRSRIADFKILIPRTYHVASRFYKRNTSFKPQRR